ncbi:MAG: hypothetical protein L0I76_30475 [Pseudonocardia sp.]|nr:hypothetical protein [Pseudonocardia sp.]
MRTATKLYRRYLEACPADEAGWDDISTADELAVSAAWNAMPLWLRAELCRRCHWIDGVWEVCPPIGRALSLGKRLRNQLVAQ